tara:strand:- start:4044 stop:5000 length:957 start_codon:yes stop_codon:yes gene_type:complete
MTNKIYLLGGGGFIGDSLQEIFSYKNIDYVIGDKKYVSENEKYSDIEKIETLKVDKSIDTIINLAAEHRDDVYPKSKYYDVNVLGSKNVCEFAEKNNINKIIFTSSVAVYGFSDECLNEEGEIKYFNEYGRTKFLAEEVYRDWYHRDPTNRTLTIVRPTVIFGEGNKGNVYNLIKQIAEKKFIMIGDGKNIKSIAYVKNVADFLTYILKYDRGYRLFNYSDKPDLDMNSLVSKINKIFFNKAKVGLRLPLFFGIIMGFFVDLISKIFKKNFPISRVRIRKFVSSTQFDSKAFSDGFSPKFPLEEALEKTIKKEFFDKF